MAVVKEFPVRRLNETSSRHATDRAGRGAMSESMRNRLAWTVAGLALLALVVVMRVLLPPPAIAGMEPGGTVRGSEVPGAAGEPGRADGLSGGEVADVMSAPLPATAAEAERAQEAAAAAAARAVAPTDAARQANANGSAAPLTSRPDFVSELEWQALKGVAAQSRDPARTLSALVEKLRFSKLLELFRSGSMAVPRADLAARLLADLPARVAAGDMARHEALGLLPSLVEPLEPDPATRAARVRQEAARLPGQALQAVP